MFSIRALRLTEAAQLARYGYGIHVWCVVHACASHICRYNPENVDTIEKYVEFQVRVWVGVVKDTCGDYCCVYMHVYRHVCASPPCRLKGLTMILRPTSPL